MSATKEERKEAARADYGRIRGPAHAAAMRICVAALAQYRSISEPAWAEYERKLREIEAEVGS